MYVCKRGREECFSLSVYTMLVSLHFLDYINDSINCVMFQYQHFSLFFVFSDFLTVPKERSDGQKVYLKIGTSKGIIKLLPNPHNIIPIIVDWNNTTKDELNFSLSRFICEIKKQYSEEYHRDTLYELVICLQLHFELQGTLYKFLSNLLFLELKNTLDRKMQGHARAEVGTNKKQTQPITVEEEQIIWQKNVLGSSKPSQL